MGLALFQFLLLVVGYLLAHLLSANEFVISIKIIIILFSGWFISMWLTHKHKLKFYQRKVKYILAPFPKALIFFLFYTLLSVIIFKSLRDGIMVLLFTIIIYSIIEYIVMLLWVSNRESAMDSIQSNIAKYNQIDLDLNKAPQQKKITDDLLKTKLSKDLYDIISPLYNKTNSTNGENGSSDDFFFGNLEQLKLLKTGNLSLIILNTRVNDLGKINNVFRKCYNALVPGGYFIICYNNISDTEYLLKKKFPSFLYKLIFPFHWLFYRVLSKTTSFAGLQEWLSSGKNKVISWVEVSGRLSYGGFDVESEERHHDKQYIIARKTKTISDNPNPSFYILIKLNRVSLHGNIIKINKVRSMYPYSEFLQKKIFEQNSIGNSGKFIDDPRITPQGKIFRKYWIDELPQLLDWLRGEIKLVGIRAMSQHFFSLYSQQYKDLYLIVKPGIISPIFDEKTDSFKDIERIEYEYLDNYSRHPLKTDWKYFWLTFQNILKGVRSK